MALTFSLKQFLLAKLFSSNRYYLLTGKNQFSIMEAQPMKDILFDTLKDKVLNGKVTLIDVREPNELKDDGKIPNSVNIPLGQIAEAFQLSTSEFQSKYGTEKPSVSDGFVISCRSGKRATNAFNKLLPLGYANAVVYTGKSNREYLWRHPLFNQSFDRRHPYGRNWPGTNYTLTDQKTSYGTHHPLDNSQESKPRQAEIQQQLAQNFPVKTEHFSGSNSFPLYRNIPAFSEHGISRTTRYIPATLIESDKGSVPKEVLKVLFPEYFEHRSKSKIKLKNIPTNEPEDHYYKDFSTTQFNVGNLGANGFTFGMNDVWQDQPKDILSQPGALPTNTNEINKLKIKPRNPPDKYNRDTFVDYYDDDDGSTTTSMFSFGNSEPNDFTLATDKVMQNQPKVISNQSRVLSPHTNLTQKLSIPLLDHELKSSSLLTISSGTGINLQLPNLLPSASGPNSQNQQAPMVDQNSTNAFLNGKMLGNGMAQTISSYVLASSGENSSSVLLQQPALFDSGLSPPAVQTIPSVENNASAEIPYNGYLPFSNTSEIVSNGSTISRFFHDKMTRLKQIHNSLGRREKILAVSLLLSTLSAVIWISVAFYRYRRKKAYPFQKNSRKNSRGSRQQRKDLLKHISQIKDDNISTEGDAEHFNA